jgi:sulfate transport system permease protein
VFIMTALVVVPLVNVFVEAFAAGLGTYWQNLVGDPDTRHSILLTLMVAPTAVVLNLIFGLAAAWAIARFKFPGRAFLTALIDLPFTVSPSSSASSCCSSSGSGLLRAVAPRARHQDRVRVPGPRDRHLLRHVPGRRARAHPAHGSARRRGGDRRREPRREAVAALAHDHAPEHQVGAPLRRHPLQRRAMGEFGAVFVVSGHIAGKTDTMPLRIEKLFQEYNLPGSFAVASVLALLALVTLLVKTTLEWRTRREIEEHKRMLTLGGEA